MKAFLISFFPCFASGKTTCGLGFLYTQSFYVSKNRCLEDL